MLPRHRLGQNSQTLSMFIGITVTENTENKCDNTNLVQKEKPPLTARVSFFYPLDKKDFLYIVQETEEEEKFKNYKIGHFFFVYSIYRLVL